MKTRVITALFALAAAAALAEAQPSGTVTYKFVFTSPGAPGSGTNHIHVPPGTPVSVSVLASFDPGIGQVVGSPPGPVAGLSDGSFGIAGSGIAGSGAWSGNTNPIPWHCQGIPNAAQPGVNAGLNVNGVIWGYGFLMNLPHPAPENPATIWQGTFTINTPGLVNFSFAQMTLVGVFYGSTGVPMAAMYNATGTPGTIETGFPIPCYPDCNESGSLTIADFACFQTEFATGSSYADCDASGVLTIADFGCFQAKFVQGCP